MSRHSTTTTISAFETTDYVLESSPTGEHFAFATSARTGPDHLFRFVWTLAPGKRGPGEHIHETETESFEIVSGTLRIWIAGKPRDYAPGERVTILPMTPHRFLNPGQEPVVVNVSLDGSRMEDVFMPCAVANAEKPGMRNIFRMFVTLPIVRPSWPVKRIERTLFLGFIGLLRCFGVKPFSPVLGWDTGAKISKKSLCTPNARTNGV